MRFRQVHLDFHTSEAIGDIGASFSKKQFQEALKKGCVDSITIFAKCHHGWAYHNSTTNEMHPGLNFDLLQKMIGAAHEIDVKTPVYISAGLDEKMARRHPEWLIRTEKEQTNWAVDFMHPGYHQFCMNTPYLDYLSLQVGEVVEKYDCDGIFLDIVGIRECYCQYCTDSIRTEGLDPRNIEAMKNLWERTYFNYTTRINKIIHDIKPGMPIFHNSGHITRGRRDLALMNTHLELESLPTGGWGYDHLPLSARYSATLGVEYLAMTGKFHTTWGEFGGFKHPNALRYEAALALANGAHSSVGDQLHPSGTMDMATYTLIGSAYREVMEKEEWCRGAKSLADICLLSAEAEGVKADHDVPKSDEGAVRILLEGKFLFDVIDREADFDKYKLMILPDKIRINPELKDKIDKFLSKGKKVLATGGSGLNLSGDCFEIDLGVKWKEANKFKPDYFRPGFTLKNLENTSFVMYSQGQKIELSGGIELGMREDPYFNRDIFAFCSHQHTPNSEKYGGPGMVVSDNGIYIAWDVFSDYANKGSLFLKEILVYALDLILGKEKTLSVDLPAQGIVTLSHQETHKRYVNHLLYASPVRRGSGTEIIEDILPVYDIKTEVRVKEKIKRAYLAPSGKQLDFEQKNGVIKYTIPELECHQMVILEY